MIAMTLLGIGEMRAQKGQNVTSQILTIRERVRDALRKM